MTAVEAIAICPGSRHSSCCSYLTRSGDGAAIFWLALSLMHSSAWGEIRNPQPKFDAIIRCMLGTLVVTISLAFSLRSHVNTVIVVSEGSAHKGPHYQLLDYVHHSYPLSVLQKRALEDCAHDGGINPSVVLSTTKRGYFAIATSKISEDTRIVGWAGPLSTPEAATTQALAHCKSRGGKDPKIYAQWGDGV